MPAVFPMCTRRATGLMRRPRVALGRALGALIPKCKGVAKKMRYGDKQRRLFQRGQDTGERPRRVEGGG